MILRLELRACFPQFGLSLLQSRLPFPEGGDVFLESADVSQGPFEPHRDLEELVGEDVAAQGVPERGLALHGVQDVIETVLMGVVIGGPLGSILHLIPAMAGAPLHAQHSLQRRQHSAADLRLISWDPFRGSGRFAV